MEERAVTLESAKKHLNIDVTFTDDDKYISDLVEVAEVAVCNHLCVKSIDEVGGEKVPPPVIHAILMMVANLYANREPISYTSVTEIPISYKYLLSPYISYL